MHIYRVRGRAGTDAAMGGNSGVVIILALVALVDVVVLLPFNFVVYSVLSSCPAGDAFSRCSLSWWHLTELLIVVPVLVQVLSNIFDERRNKRPQQLPIFLLIVLALAVLLINGLILVERYHEIGSLPSLFTADWAALFIDFLFVLTAGAYLVLEMAVAFLIDAQYDDDASRNTNQYAWTRRWPE